MTGRLERLGLTLGALALAAGCALPGGTPEPRPSAEGRVSTAGALVSVGTLSGILRGPRPGLIADNAASVLSNNASGLVANNGGGLIANNGGGLVSDRGGSYRVRSVADLTAPVADAEVIVVDAQGRPLTAKAVKTDADGRYTVTGLKIGRGVFFLKAAYTSEGQAVTLMAPAAAQPGSQEVSVDPASTLVAKKLSEQLRTGAVKPESVRPAALAEAATAIGQTMTPKAVTAAAILPPAKAAETYDAMLDTSDALAGTIATAQAKAEAEAEAASPAPGVTVAPSPTASPTPTAAPASSAPASPAPSPTATVTAPIATLAPVETALAGLVSTLAGGPTDGMDDGTGVNATFSGPTDLVVDAVGNVLVSDSDNQAIRRVSPAGVVTLVAGGGVTSPLGFPVGLALDKAGTLYVSDIDHHVIWKVSPSGVITRWAGIDDNDLINGPVASAAFDEPRGIAFDRAGNLFVADTDNYAIRKISPAGVVSTFAGGRFPGATDGTGGAAQFSQPWGLAIDGADNLYVADRMAGTVRKITPLGVVTTLPGRFTYPADVAVSTGGTLYVTEELGYRVSRVDAATGAVSLLAGAGFPGFANGTGAAAKFKGPSGLAIDTQGRLYVGDTDNHRIRRIQ